jgi:hypothetical protein
MRMRLGNVLSTVVIISVGFITLVGLLVSPEFDLLWSLANDIGRLPLFASLFVQIAVLVVALMIILGIVNLIIVHFLRFRTGEGAVLNRVNSLVLLITFFLTLGLYFFERVQNTPSSASASRVLLEQVQVAIESALAALLFFSLVYGASRILRIEVSLYRVLFVAVIVFVLVAALPLNVPGMNLVASAYNWLLLVPANAGARGLLIGIGLATALTGLRVLFGQDKTYH